jgi:hypothetical protein
MKAPLLIDTDVMNMSAATLKTFSNAEVVGVNQDELGEQARLLKPIRPGQLAWVGNLSRARLVVLLVNTQDTPQDLSFALAQRQPSPPPTPLPMKLFPWAVDPASASNVSIWSLGEDGTARTAGLCLTAASTVGLIDCNPALQHLQRFTLEQNGNLVRKVLLFYFVCSE